MIPTTDLLDEPPAVTTMPVPSAPPVSAEPAPVAAPPKKPRRKRKAKGPVSVRWGKQTFWGDRISYEPGIVILHTDLTMTRVCFPVDRPVVVTDSRTTQASWQGGLSAPTLITDKQAAEQERLDREAAALKARQRSEVAGFWR